MIRVRARGMIGARASARVGANARVRGRVRASATARVRASARVRGRVRARARVRVRARAGWLCCRNREMSGAAVCTTALLGLG